MSENLPGVPLSNQSASNTHSPVVQIAGSNTGSISIAQRAKLPVMRVPRKDIAAISEPMWAFTPTPQQAISCLGLHGIAVIVGEHGTGRRTSAIKALHDHLAGHGNSPQLFDVAADWDDDEVPHREVLPDPVRGNGYLIDAASRTFSVATALALKSWADELHTAGACTVITGSERDWRGDSGLQIPAVPPDPVRVARNYLAEQLDKPIQAQWLLQDPGQASNRGFLRSGAVQDPTIGVFSGLITRKVSPSDAIAIAERLAAIEPNRVSNALEKSGDRQPEVQDRGRKELSVIRDEVLRWTSFLEKILTEAGTHGPDRIMLLSAAYLEGAPLELCIRAASEFTVGAEPIARRYREGRSPRRRMIEVGVDVTSEDKAQFESRPGLASSAISMDWHHWADERTETRQWLERITVPGGVAEAWAMQIGGRLLDLSCTTAADPPFFKVLEYWVGIDGLSENRLQAIAQLLASAAQRGELTRETHRKLIEWARKGAQHRRVVAYVCSGNYGLRWPHIALVRLRHILSDGDLAAEIAAEALLRYAARGGDELIRIIDTVEGWFERYRNHPAGARAFLALIDPAKTPNILPAIITLAQTTPRFRDFLVTGWCATLEQSDVREQAYRTLLAWAQAVEDGRLSSEFVYGILTDVRSVHTPVDAMSRFLYGNPSHDDPALISARFALANLRPCAHTSCPHPECPILQEASDPSGNGQALGSGSPSSPASGAPTQAETSDIGDSEADF